MESVGARLKKIRLEKALTLEEVQKKTKIHLNILKAIEEDSLITLSPVYIKGFLKIYCKFLGVDPRDYISDYKEPQGAIYFRLPKKEGAVLPHRDIFTKFLSIVPRIKIKIIFIIILIAILVIGLFNLGKTVSSKYRFFSQKAKLSSVAPLKTKDENQASKLEKFPSANLIRLGIHTKENCYISLKTDGHLVFQGSLRKGISESWQAKNKIELSLGNAGAVDLEINGKLISGLGRRGQAIKNILITKDGLSIPR